ncbi:MAG: hypothetical protein Q8L76_08550, partial [Cypionkella sp.]|nr:hypothetical protein [Cypionkella sp.]
IAIRSSLPSEQENQNLNALGIPSESETMAVGMSFGMCPRVDTRLPPSKSRAYPPFVHKDLTLAASRKFLKIPHTISVSEIGQVWAA